MSDKALIIAVLDTELLLTRQQKGKNAGIAKILVGSSPPGDADRAHAGMGILVDPFHVITCAHVVNTALGLPDASQGQPQTSVLVCWPMLGDTNEMMAQVVAWRPPGMQPQDDIAVLRLPAAAPKEVGLAVLADVVGIPPDGDALSVFGVAAGKRLGHHIDARFKGPASAAWVQIDGLNNADAFVVGGFSGGGVWSYPHDALLGMIVAKNLAEQQSIAYMIPVFVLRQIWPGLQVEQRTQSASFARTWTMLSAAFFVLIFAHLAVNRGLGTFAAVTFSGNHKQLAVFYGMHIYAFIAPFVTGMLIAFTRSFRLHAWFARVPSFGSFRKQPLPSSSRRAALASLLAFVILPLAAQIHFIRILHSEGHVYYDPRDFGLRAGECKHYDEEAIRCTDDYDDGDADPDLYTLKSGAKIPYWDHAYQYGERTAKGLETATFFPLYQPLSIIALTIISATLSAAALYLVLRQLPRQMRRDFAPPPAPPHEPAVPGA